MPYTKYNSEYLADNDWNNFQENLVIAMSICSELAKKHGCKIFNDSRWPATGLKIQSFCKTKYIRISLNHNYLEDKKVFFELRVHTVIKIPFIYNKIADNKIIKELNLDQIIDKELIYNYMEKSLQE